MKLHILCLNLLLIMIGCNRQTTHPTRGEIVEAVYGLGIIKSDKTYHAKAAIVSSVAEFYVTEGQDVQKGQKLFITDQSALYRAPFTGKITDIPVTIGENLFPQTLILSLIDLRNLYLEVSLEQQAAMRLRKGMEAEITFEFFRNKKLRGKISSIYPKNDQFVARVLLDKWPAEVLPGMSADVAFNIARKKNTVLVPTKAIANGHIVIKRKGTSMKIKIDVGLSDENLTEVLSPELFPNDEVILP
jgi:macrolide-specific efflux system membrane fusion protein